MTDLMTIAKIQLAERHELLRQHALTRQAIDAEKAEHTRFMTAYRIRHLLNRFAPALAPRLGI